MIGIASCALADCCDSLQTAKTIGEFRGVANAAARQLGFQWYAYLRLSEHTPALLSSYPSLFQRRYVDLRLCDEDPIVRHAKLVSAPFSWGDIEKADLRFNSNERVAREAMKCGIRSGVTIPIHSGFNTFASLSFAADGAAPPSLAQDTSALQLMALQFHVHFTNKAEGAELSPERVLTHRQQECLKWSARGKTMSEIGTILGISGRTVLFHLQDARQRLNAQTITQAVAMAIHLKEIPEV
jgi:LuxR family transcriptional regulator, activator of conjugal transfer of Ti plasmids